MPQKLEKWSVGAQFLFRFAPKLLNTHLWGIIFGLSCPKNLKYENLGHFFAKNVPQSALNLRFGAQSSIGCYNLYIELGGAPWERDIGSGVLSGIS